MDEMMHLELGYREITLIILWTVIILVLVIAHSYMRGRSYPERKKKKDIRERIRNYPKAKY